MANNKTTNKKMEEVINRIKDEPNKANDSIIQINAFIKRIVTDKNIDSDIFQSFKESINSYLSSTHLNVEQKGKLLLINDELKAMKIITSVDKSKEEYNKNKTKTNDTTTDNKNANQKTNDTKSGNRQQVPSQNDNMIMDKFQNLIKQENNQISNKLISIETKVKTLGEDLEHNKILINRSIKDVQEHLDPIKAISNKIDKVNDSINNIEVGTVKKTRTDIPKDVQAIEKLTEFMKEGLEQFENIATYYVSKQSEFEKAEKTQKELDSKIEEEKAKAFKEGELKSKIDIAKIIHNKFPNDFDKIKSVFEDVLVEKYKVNDSIEITSENSQNLEVYIEGKVESGTYIIKSPAVLIGEEVLIRATIEISK